MSKYTAFRCPTGLLEVAKRIANQESRSLSNYIIRLLQDDACRRMGQDGEKNFYARKHLYRDSHSLRVAR
jgi:hypothetical protein